MIVEGRNAVEELLKSGATIDRILIDKGNSGSVVDLIKSSGVQYQFVDRVALDRHAESKRHQGFVAFTTEHNYNDLKDLLDGEVLLILDGVVDVHNFGNIIRTAECMGVDGIIIPKNRSATVNDTVVRISAGASTHMKIARVSNINQTIERLKSESFWVFAGEASGDDIRKTNLTGKVAIVMGGEDTGVSPLTKKLCDGVISIPMRGKVNSLNVANAAAMILYEVFRNR